MEEIYKILKSDPKERMREHLQKLELHLSTSAFIINECKKLKNDKDTYL
jgi:hypothetical protein